MALRHFIDAGWKVVLLIGGGTGMIGDPGGKSEERNLLTLEQVEKNRAALAQQIGQVWGGQKFEMVNNADWLSNLKLLDFLRDAGKHFGMTMLMQRDYISQRIGEGGSGMSFAEFAYTLLQGYDYWHLFKTKNVTLQIGGSDQWGNMISGVDLIRKKEGAETNVVTVPIIVNRATGKKFGKSEAGAIWLNSAKTSVYQFYQFWLNVDDEGAIEYLKIFTLLSKEEIGAIEKEFAANPRERAAQKALAYQVTSLVHGVDRAQAAKRVSEALFSGDYAQLSSDDFALLSAEVTTIDVRPDTSLVNVLVEARLAKSMTEARRFVETGAVYLNAKASAAGDLSSMQPLQGYIVVRRGKKDMALVRVAQEK
jgi:tyrosyl-tRNA synthetase